MKRIKVVIVVPSLVTGGAENVVCQLSKALNKECVQIKVICLSVKKNTSFEHDLLNSGIDVIYLNNNGKLSLKTMMLLWRFLSKYKPDIIHTHLHASLYAFPWVYTHKVLLLHTIHSTPKFEFSSRIIQLMNKLYKSNKAVPVAISDKIRLETAKLYSLPINRIELIYNPVNINRFKKTETKANNGIKFIHVARLDPQKNQSLLIKAFAIVKKEKADASLVIVGDGELRKELKALVHSLNLEDCVTFTGNIPNVEHYLHDADIFVLSSTNEGLPLSILEAMAAGLPIISTKVGGIEDIIVGNGILVESGDIQAISNAMLKLSNDNHLRNKMAMASLLQANKYDISIVAKEYERLYHRYSLHA